MIKSKILLTASFFAATLMVGALTGSANAAPIVKPQAQIAQAAEAASVQLVRGGHRGHRHGLRRHWWPRKHWRPGRWCRNRPRRCHGYRYWRYGIGYGGGALCHRHLDAVSGMAFHAKVRCGHRHYRAYNSWEWVR